MSSPVEPKYGIVPPSTIEPKVKAATGGAGAGGVIAGFIIWLLDELFWEGAGDPEVPLPVVLLVTLVVPAAIAFASGYYARHVNRLPLA
jgi:hypothetical protein